MKGSWIQRSLASLAGPGCSLDSLSCITPAPSESLYDSQPQPTSWSLPPNPEPQHPVTSPVVSMQTSILRLGSVGVQHPLVNPLPSKRLLLHSSLKSPSLPLPQPLRGFLRLQKLFLLLSSFPGVQVPAPRSFSLYFPISFALSCSVEISLPFLEVWGLLPMFRKCSAGVVPHADAFFIQL